MKCVLLNSTSLVVGLLACLPAFFGYLFFNMMLIEQRNQMCWKNLTDNGITVCRPKCHNGTFSLPGMQSCQSWLRCSDLHEVKPIKALFRGVVKNVHLAEWKGFLVVLSSLSMNEYEDDFQHHIKMLKAFGPSPYVVQLIGYCNNTVVTEYHKLGSAINVNDLLSEKFIHLDSAVTRLGLCVHYASIIAFLHNSPVGTRVMCDSSTLNKTLSQYLLTENFHLVLNDLDALPEVNHSVGQKVKCGHVQLNGEFVAPEQLWPYSNEVYNDEKMPNYDEKSDVWKLPNICNWFLGEKGKYDSVKFMLFEIHRQCKEIVPSRRPTALSVLEKYNVVLHELNLIEN